MAAVPRSADVVPDTAQPVGKLSRARGLTEQLGRALELDRGGDEPDLAAAADDHIGDDMLSLVFTTCHPMLPTQSRVALTLRMMGGLTTKEIA